MILTDNEERFRFIPGYPGYCFSSKGRVVSMKGRKLRVLKPTVVRGGYLKVALCAGRGIDEKLVHRMVARAFLGPCPHGMQVCHNDGDPTNNRIENLRYDTRAGNEADKKKHGTEPTGEQNGRAKLTADQVRAIRSDPRIQREIAADYGISRPNVSNIKSRKYWGHIV